MIVNELVQKSHGCMNSHGVERVLKAAVPQLRKKLATLPPSPERDMMAELLECIALLGGCAADGAREAHSAALYAEEMRYR